MLNFLMKLTKTLIIMIQYFHLTKLTQYATLHKVYMKNASHFSSKGTSSWCLSVNAVQNCHLYNLRESCFTRIILVQNICTDKKQRLNKKKKKKLIVSVIHPPLTKCQSFIQP